jgi:hypothetical protein
MNKSFRIVWSATVTVTGTAASDTVTAAAKTKVYGDNDPALTYTANVQSGGVGLITGRVSRVA